jgi:hypothetical protein
MFYHVNLLHLNIFKKFIVNISIHLVYANRLESMNEKNENVYLN